MGSGIELTIVRSGAAAQTVVALPYVEELRRSAAWLKRASNACWSAGRFETARVLTAKANRTLAEAELAERYGTDPAQATT